MTSKCVDCAEMPRSLHTSPIDSPCAYRHLSSTFLRLSGKWRNMWIGFSFSWILTDRFQRHVAALIPTSDVLVYSLLRNLFCRIIPQAKCDLTIKVARGLIERNIKPRFYLTKVHLHQSFQSNRGFVAHTSRPTSGRHCGQHPRPLQCYRADLRHTRRQARQPYRVCRNEWS